MVGTGQPICACSLSASMCRSPRVHHSPPCASSARSSLNPGTDPSGSRGCVLTGWAESDVERDMTTESQWGEEQNWHNLLYGRPTCFSAIAYWEHKTRVAGAKTKVRDLSVKQNGAKVEWYQLVCGHQAVGSGQLPIRRSALPAKERRRRNSSIPS